MHTAKEIALIAESVLNHAVTSTDQRLVCTMAMVCKGWRTAVKDKAPAGSLDVSLEVGNRWAPDDAGMPSDCMPKLASFSQWLPQHAKLVRKLRVYRDENCPQGESKALAETVFSLALRSAAAACIGTSAQQQLQPLGLQSYRSNVLDTSAVLQSLPVASLTELIITGSDRSALAAALPRLINLQRLEMDSRCNMPAVLQAAQHLSALTELSFPNQCISSSDVKLLPPHMLRLEVCVSGREVVDFSHITRLTNLIIGSSLCVGYRFPAQLVELSIEDGLPTSNSEQDDALSVVKSSNISSLKCLDSLDIRKSRQSAEDLLQLVALPKLQQLSLSYYFDTQTALAASAAWPKLQQLRYVHLKLADDCSSSECIQLFRSLGKVTWLTQLHADIEIDDDTDIELDEDAEQQSALSAICSEICKLQMLQNLYLNVSGGIYGLQQSPGAQDDLARLSNLTQLTRLHLCARDDFDNQIINDATVARILLSMKQLRELSVPVKSVAVLPVIAQLSNLEVLDLRYPPRAVQQSGLQCLQGMKSLTVLKGFTYCSKQQLADFWAAVRA